jgi:hypothetical protein
MAVIVLILMAGMWWWVGGQPVPDPRLLGALAGAGGASERERSNIGGVGRFSRPRKRGATRL